MRQKFLDSSPRSLQLHNLAFEILNSHVYIDFIYVYNLQDERFALCV